MILGNLLKENISNLPVVIVEKNILNELIEKEFLNDIDNILNGTYFPDINKKIYNFRLIPYSSLGNENGLLIGVKPDYVKIYTDEDFEKKEVFIGIYQGYLCGKRNDYHAIVGL